MEKVMRAGIRLMMLFLIVLIFSCVEKKPDTIEDSINAGDSLNPEVYLFHDTVLVSSVPLFVVEIFEYRSQELPGYELYAVWPFGGVSQFVIQKNGNARLLVRDGFNEAGGAQVLKDDEFVVIELLEQNEINNIITFEKLKLKTSTGREIIFNHSQTKRSLIIGSAYSYAGENGSGELTLTQIGDGYKFSVNTTAGEHICELEGAIRVKGNIGYYQGEPYKVRCTLIFLFSNDAIEILSVSSDSDCGCGTNTSLNHQFNLNKKP